MRERDLLGAMARARPHDRFPVLGEGGNRKIRDAVDAASDPFQLSSLCKPG